jgi:uncharacterized protein (TIGR02246 family)
MELWLMKPSFSLALAVSLLTASIVPCEAQDLTAEVEEVAKQYDAALLKKDADFLDKLFDEEGNFVDEQGKLFDKKQWRAELDKVNFATGKSLERSFRRVGDSVIEVGIWEATGTREGKEFTFRNRYCDVWAKKGNRWVITFEQGTPVTETPVDDASAVKELANAVEEFNAAFNQHDAKAAAMKYTEDGDFMYLDERSQGRAAIEKGFEDYFAKNPNVKTKLSVTARKMLSPNIVVQQGTWDDTGTSNPIEPTKGYFTWVLVRQNGQWLISVDRGVPLKAESP